MQHVDSSWRKKSHRPSVHNKPTVLAENDCETLVADPGHWDVWLCRFRFLVQHLDLPTIVRLSFDASLLLIDQRLHHWRNGVLVHVSTPRMPARVNVDRHSGFQRSLLHHSPWSTHQSNLSRSSFYTGFCSPSPRYWSSSFQSMLSSGFPSCSSFSVQLSVHPLSTSHLRLSSCRRELRSGFFELDLHVGRSSFVMFQVCSCAR